MFTIAETSAFYLGLGRASGATSFWSREHPASPSEGSSQCEILLISCDVTVVKHFLFNIFSNVFVVLFPGTNVSGFRWAALCQALQTTDKRAQPAPRASASAFKETTPCAFLPSVNFLNETHLSSFSPVSA